MANSYMIGEKETRVWGHFEVIHTGENHTCKILVVKPHCHLSLQSHQYRAEHWVVVQGTATVQLGKEILEVPQCKHILVGKNQIHCLANNTEAELVLVEVQVGERLDEADIIRYEQTKNLIHKKQSNKKTMLTTTLPSKACLFKQMEIFE